MPRVSVLLPTHNRADVVGFAIQSVLAQTEADVELLVVADGCTDATVPLVAAIGDPRIRLFDLPKAPYYGYANRNIALREARGDFIAFAAHDDLLFPDHLEQLIAKLEATGREWIYSRPLWVSTDGIVVPFATNLMVPDELTHFLTVGNSIPASCVLYRRTCLDRYGAWPENVPSAADWRHWCAIIEGGGRRNFTYLPTPTCLHFSANWKKSRYSAVEEVRTWLEVADSSAWWPPALRYSIPPGTAEQQVIADAMRAGGSTWREDVRAAAALVIDRLSWDDIRIIRPTLRASSVEIQRLRTRLGTIELEAERARCELESRELESQQLRSRIRTLEDDYARAREALAALDATRAQVQALQSRLALTLTSTSWRITAPMRNLKELWTGIGARR